MSGLRVHSITFEPDGIVIAYQDLPTDVRVEGKVALMHQAFVSADHPDYAEDMDLLHRQAVRMLSNVLDDHAESDPHQPESPQEDEPDLGMGMGAARGDVGEQGGRIKP